MKIYDFTNEEKLQALEFFYMTGLSHLKENSDLQINGKANLENIPEKILVQMYAMIEIMADVRLEIISDVTTAK